MVIPNSIVITGCRICGGTLEPVGSLGDIAVSNFTDKPVEPVRLPLELVWCDDCKLLQLAHNFNRDLLYKKYWYKSGLNPTIVEDLKQIAKWGKGTHIDIGSGDGTLLKYSNAIDKFAVDPSDLSPEEITGTFHHTRNYFEDVDLGYKADVITAIACLYDLPDPVRFMWNVKRHLKKDGVFIAQLMTLQPMLDNNDVGNICHEHLEYYSYPSLVKLCSMVGLQIFKVETNNMNGGSYRLFIQHKTYDSVYFDEPNYTLDDMKAFMTRIQKNKTDYLDTLPTVVGYGASTKASTIMDYYGSHPEFVVDINPDKIGKYMTSGSKVVSEIPAGTKCLWVFPYGFLEDFRQREANYKGLWLTTMPDFRVVG